jgi:RND superfamily putative drug exporter
VDARPPRDPTRPEVPFTGRVAARVLAHRRAVMGLWLVLLVAGGVAAGRVTNRLTYDFALPGQPGYETAHRIVETFGNGGENNPIIAEVTPPPGRTAAADAPAIARAFAHLSGVGRLRVVDYATTGNPVFNRSGSGGSWALVLTPPFNGFSDTALPDRIDASLASSLPGYEVRTTGLDQLASGSSSHGPGVLVETLVGGLGALAVLAFVFASLLALIPLLIAAVSIVTTLLVVLGLTYLTSVSFIVQFLVSLIGLGVAIDYSLLLVTRWREERDHGASNEAAVVTAASTAGRTVALSGLTVGIGLLALIVLPMPALRSVGVGGMLIPLVSVTVVLTLLPALLGRIGPRLDWPHRRHEDRASRAWTRWARGVVRRRWLGAAVALGALAILIVPVFGLKVGQDSLAALNQSGSAHATLADLERGGVPTGVLTPLELLARAPAGPALARRLEQVNGIVAVAPAGTAGGWADYVALPATASLNNSTLGPVDAARVALRGQPGFVGLAGAGPSLQDFSRAIYGNFPVMFSIIAVLTLVLLTVAFRSAVLAVKAVALNLLSLAATFGFMAWFWQEGHGSAFVFSIRATGAITFWIPLMVFAFLFGLSMDYEVFILTRMREEYDRGGDTRAAVVEGLGRTGRLVTSAALILFLAFASLASAPVTDIKVLATGLGVGILLDATVVRALLVPALVALLGRWNWWLPGRLGAWSARRAPAGTDPAVAAAVAGD